MRWNKPPVLRFARMSIFNIGHQQQGEGDMDGAGIAIPARAAQVAAPGRVDIVESEPPRPGPGKVRVRLEGSGVCASNLEPWAGPDWMDFPLEPGGLGHEGWGRIDAVGEGVDAGRLGERVAVFGDHSFATHEVVPEDAALTVPRALAGQPVPAEPVACALSIFRMARVGRGDRVAIIGAGFLGLLLTRLATRAGARVIALSRRAESLDRARAWGAQKTVALDDEPVARVMEATDDAGCDICIECTGHQRPLDLAGAITRESGRIVIAGFHQDGPRQIDMQHWNWRAFEIVNAHVRDRATILATMREALEAMASGVLDVRPLLTHRYPLHRLGEALDATRDKPAGFVKAWIEMPADAPRPRLGFLGLGWIGVNRMEALARSGLCEVAMLADADCRALDAVAHAAPEAARGRALEDVLAERPDGVVIATPSALHAHQAIAALEAGAAVFCQKPLGRTEAETRAVVEAAERANRLLAVDLSYRRTAAMQAIAREMRSGALGQVFHVDLTFHNAYGPDKPWFRDPAQSGGGCLMDLGVHLIDLACWLLDARDMDCRHARLLSGGAPLRPGGADVEDFALATLETASGTSVRLACSWNLKAGCNARIGVELHGTEGGLRFRNVGGSFYDFEAHRLTGCEAHRLAAPPDDWGGRTACDWLERLASDPGFDPACRDLVGVSRILDSIYGTAAAEPAGAPSAG